MLHCPFNSRNCGDTALNQKSTNYRGTASKDECARRKKSNTRGSTTRMCVLVTNYSGDVWWKEGDVSATCTPPLAPRPAPVLAEPEHISVAQGWWQEVSGCPDFPLDGLSLPFSPTLWSSLSFLFSTCLPPLFFPSPFLPQRDEQMFTYAHLLSFRGHSLCLGTCQCWFEGIIQVLSCSFPFPRESLGKPVLGIYRDYIICIYEFVEINHLSHFATVFSP